jgi:hypothetical protein
MKRFLMLIVILCLGKILTAQYVYTIKADSVKITNHCDTAELILENHTQNVLGFLYNKGRGRTEFRKLFEKISDSIYISGNDTLNLSKFWIQGGNRFNTTGVLGTVDNNAVSFISNGQERMRVLNGGQIAIGTSTPTGRFSVSDSTGAYGHTIVNTYGNVNGYLRSTITNSNNGAGAAAGFLSLNDVGEGLQIYMGCSGNGYAARRAMIRSSGNNGFKLTTDKGVIQFQVGTVVPTTAGLGDTANVKMIIDSFGLRLRKADQVPYADTSTFHALVINKSDGRIYKANNVSAGNNYLSRAAISDVDYPATTSDYLIAYTVITTGRTVTLPAANTMTNKSILIKDESGSAGTHFITIDGLGSEMIDGAATKIINTNYGGIALYSNGSDWFTLPK